MKKATSTIPVPLFGSKLTLCLTREAWTRVARQCGAEEDATEESYGLCFGGRNRAGEQTYVVGVFDRSIGTLAHELVHVVTHVFRDVGIPVSAENEEMFAYMMQHLMYEILPAFGAKQHAGRK